MKQPQERTDGTRIELPMPYFGAISHRVTAQQLARLLAGRLGVVAVESL